MDNIALTYTAFILFPKPFKRCDFILFSRFDHYWKHPVFQFAIVCNDKINLHIISMFFFIVMTIKVKFVPIFHQHLCYCIFIEHSFIDLHNYYSVSV